MQLSRPGILDPMCSKCDYPLTGLPVGVVCPECGKKSPENEVIVAGFIPDFDTMTYQPTPSSPWWYKIFGLMTLIPEPKPKLRLHVGNKGYVKRTPWRSVLHNWEIGDAIEVLYLNGIVCLLVHPGRPLSFAQLNFRGTEETAHELLTRLKAIMATAPPGARVPPIKSTIHSSNMPYPH